MAAHTQNSPKCAPRRRSKALSEVALAMKLVIFEYEAKLAPGTCEARKKTATTKPQAFLFCFASCGMVFSTLKVPEKHGKCTRAREKCNVVLF